jgi:hypothetical protein
MEGDSKLPRSPGQLLDLQVSTVKKEVNMLLRLPLSSLLGNYYSPLGLYTWEDMVGIMCYVGNYYLDIWLAGIMCHVGNDHSDYMLGRGCTLGRE